MTPASCPATYVMDETYIGGATQNWHRNDKRRSKFGNDTSRKMACVALISEDTGEVRTLATMKQQPDGSFRTLYAPTWTRLRLSFTQTQHRSTTLLRRN